MEAFKSVYEKNREEKKTGKFALDELGYYHQFFEDEMTVGKYSKLLTKK